MASSSGQLDSGTLPLCITYGNCQATALGRVLSASPAFAAEYRVVPAPAVHTIKDNELRELEELVGRASLIVAHPVGPGYRGMDLGTDEVVAAAPRGCRVIRFPVMFYQGIFPFQAFVHLNGPDGRFLVDVPLTDCHHDLRIIACAAQGMDVDDTVDCLRSFVPDEAVLREQAEAAAAEIRRRERDTDIAVIDRVIARPASHAGSFFTLNHPSRLTLRHVSREVHRALGIPFEDLGNEELLDKVQTPIDDVVLRALGLPQTGRRAWMVDGRRLPIESLVEAHLGFYRDHPEVVSAALRDHVRRLRRLALVRVRRAIAHR